MTLVLQLHSMATAEHPTAAERTEATPDTAQRFSCGGAQALLPAPFHSLLTHVACAHSHVVGTGESMVEFERRVVENNIVRASDGFWNLTAFGKLFGKKFSKWHESKHAKQFVEAVQASEPGREVLIVGTSHTPTWGHYKIASDMLYQTNVHYSLWITDMACRYVCREPVKAAASFQQAATLAASSQVDRVGFVYVGSDKDGRCKVGKSKDVARREQTLRCANLDYRTIYTVGPDVHYDQAETAAHALLESRGVKRLYGEWFECEPDVAYQACKDIMLILNVTP